MALYVHYGCGLTAPDEWMNFDASPTLRLQLLPVAGGVFRRYLAPRFPTNVLFGDIVRGLPGVADSSCAAVFCSHVLEHLPLHDARRAIGNTYRMLEPGGVFRCVVPDLGVQARDYIAGLVKGEPGSATEFLVESKLGVVECTPGIAARVRRLFGHSAHLWMWDEPSLREELATVGFREISRVSYGDSSEKAFAQVEDEGRFDRSLAFQAIKPIGRNP